MYKILDLKRVFYTFQETVWSHLNNVYVHTCLCNYPLSNHVSNCVYETRIQYKLVLETYIRASFEIKPIKHSLTGIFSRVSCRWSEGSETSKGHIGKALAYRF